MVTAEDPPGRKQLIFDGHLDVSMNALEYERDQTLRVEQVRQREVGDIADGRGTCMVTLPELRRGGTSVFVGTVIARAKPWVKADRKLTRGGDWPSQDMAYGIAQGQLAYYRRMEQRRELRMIRDRAALDAHWQQWEQEDAAASGPVGMILMMEGADPIVEPGQVGEWFEQGLRCLSLAHFGHSHYAAGTPPREPSEGPGGEQDAPLTDSGRALLREMASLPMALDLTHLSDQSFAEAIDLHAGPVCATHANCRALVHTPRQLTDEQIRLIVERDGVIGTAIHNGMLRPNIDDRQAPRDSVSLSHVVDHVMHICELAGSANHVAIGSDLDGGYGRNETPRELDTHANLHRLAPLLAERGFSQGDLARFFGDNWLRFYRRVLPA